MVKKTFDEKTIRENLKYLKLLSENFPSIQHTSSEIINLNAIMNLPKGTEHFVADIHGEYEAFGHLMRNCSGSIRRKTKETLFDGDVSDDIRLNSEDELREFCTLIYYPETKLPLLKKEGKISDSWYKTAIFRLVELGKVCASKYSQSKIRNSFPVDYAYIIQELFFKSDVNNDRAMYYEEIVDAIVEIGASDDFIINFCRTIRKLCTDHLHIVGDIYDRGVGPQHVMDMLMDHHSCDIQWGNHDILWIGAAAGNLACIANAVRICMRYGNTSVLEDGYGINLMPLSFFAMDAYGDDENLGDFMPKINDEIPDIEEGVLARMQKAIAIIQFKLESAIIRRNPAYQMEDRLILDTIGSSKDTVEVNGTRYTMNASFFPTVDPADPCTLTPEEEKVIASLHASFTASEKLRRHTTFLLNKGSMYLVYNDNLLFHAGIPLTKDLAFESVALFGENCMGKSLLDAIDADVRKTFYSASDMNKDLFWWLWCAPDSPLFGKDKMATFERYFLDDKTAHKENYLPFYKNIESEEMSGRILREFGISPEIGHIICGHVPVKTRKGENPVKASGRIICIDAGFSKAYQKETGVAGCTLTYNSYGMTLIIHEQFTSLDDALERGFDITSETRFVNQAPKRLYVKDTDTGKALMEQILYLEMLLFAFRNGDIPQRI